MKIITWNVNGIRACSQKGLFEYLHEQKPDALCLQETKAHPDQLDDIVKNQPGYLSFWSSAERKGYSGIATYLKRPPASVTYGIGVDKFDREGRFVITDHRDFVLFNVYFPNGGAREERHLFKQEFLKIFSEHLVQLAQSGREVVLVGDYNVAYLDFDVYDPVRLSRESGFLPEEREWFRQFLSMGFVDVFRQEQPLKKGAFTWWSYREGARYGNRGWRIDHICVTPGLASLVKKCEIHDQVTGSDHCPVMVEFDL